jgi:hypothetical protein
MSHHLTEYPRTSHVPVETVFQLDGAPTNWRFVKNIVYCEKVQNINELYDRLIRAAECITNKMLANTWQEVNIVMI